MSSTGPPPGRRRAGCSPPHLLGEHRVEHPRLADLAGPQVLDRGEVRRVEVQPVRDHQLHPGVGARGDHLAGTRPASRPSASRTGRGPWPCRRHRVLAVHRVRQHDVHGVDRAALQQVAVLLVPVGGHAVLFADRLVLDRVARDDRGEFGVRRVLEPGEDGGLREPPDPDHRVTDLVGVVRRHLVVSVLGGWGGEGEKITRRPGPPPGHDAASVPKFGRGRKTGRKRGRGRPNSRRWEGPHRPFLTRGNPRSGRRKMSLSGRAGRG